MQHHSTTRQDELNQQAMDLAREGNTQALRQLIASGLSVNLCDAQGQSLLMLASYHGRLETTAMLIEFGAKVDQRNQRGQTPLGGAAYKGFESMVRLLVENGADTQADQGDGYTALTFAEMFGHHEVANYLRACSRSKSKKSEASSPADVAMLS